MFPKAGYEYWFELGVFRGAAAVITCFMQTVKRKEEVRGKGTENRDNLASSSKLNRGII